MNAAQLLCGIWVNFPSSFSFFQWKFTLLYYKWNCFTTCNLISICKISDVVPCWVFLFQSWLKAASFSIQKSKNCNFHLQDMWYRGNPIWQPRLPCKWVSLGAQNQSSSLLLFCTFSLFFFFPSESPCSHSSSISLGSAPQTPPTTLHLCLLFFFPSPLSPSLLSEPTAFELCISL